MVTLAERISGALLGHAAGAHPLAAGCGGDDTSIANGSLMRALGPGIAHRDHADQRRRAAAALSAITHGHPVCVDACVVYANIVSDLLHGHRPHDVLDGYLWPDPIHAALNDAHRGLGVDLAGTGSVVDSLRLAGAALVAAAQRDLETVVVDVVNRGGDADTNAAIAGGLLGARHGRSAVPDRWVGRLEQRSRIERGAAQLAELASTGGGAS